MTNNRAWQVMSNANSSSKAVLINSTHSDEGKEMPSTKKAVGQAKVIVMPKRYSFDDNGGGYRGL